jgi:anti-sigma factor RsiW
MLAYLDGELSRSETHYAKDHLHSCWTCRSEVERLKADIATILDAQNESFSPALPPPPFPWPSFNTLLARNAPSPRSPLWARIFVQANSLLSPMRILVTSAAIVVLVILAYSAFRPRPVSAKEVLRRVQIADTNRAAITKDQVIRERVHIRKTMRGGNHSQSTQVDTWKSKTAAYWNAPDRDSVASDLEAEYKAHDIPIGLPLSAASADSWGRVAGGSPTVSQQGSDIDLSFTGSGDGATGAVERVNLLIQPETWQVKQMTLEFPDASFEVTEDDFSIVPVSAVSPELLAHLEPEAIPQMLAHSVAHSLPGTTASLIHRPVVDLDHAELDVFATLHRLNADLGEPVTVIRSSHSVQVGLWQLPPDRQNELRAALEPEAGVEVELAAPQRSSAISRPAIAPLITAASGPLYIPAESGGDDQRLLKHFGSAEKEQEFTDQALATSTVILSHLYALRNLQGQFPPEKEQSLPPEERAQLTALVRDHAAAVATSLNTLRAQLVPLNTAFHVSASKSVIQPTAINWQSGTLEALETARNGDHLLRSMLTTSQTPTTPDIALPQIGQELSHLSVELSNFNGIAH